jgi:hypothetical protein
MPFFHLFFHLLSPLQQREVTEVTLVTVKKTFLGSGDLSLVGVVSVPTIDAAKSLFHVAYGVKGNAVPMNEIRKVNGLAVLHFQTNAIRPDGSEDDTMEIDVTAFPGHFQMIHDGCLAILVIGRRPEHLVDIGYRGKDGID